MKVVGLLLVRNEDWILPLTLDAALRWCDAVVVVLHKCTDRSEAIVSEFMERYEDKTKVVYVYAHRFCKDDEHWQEMTVRDGMYRLAKGFHPDATHFAMIDADEVLTHNLLPSIRGWCEQLAPGQILDLPMIAPSGSFTLYRADACVWTKSRITCAFRDAEGLGWKPRGTYHFHNRNPHGCRPDRISPLNNVSTGQCEGGVFHLQWANKRRLKAKHVWYKLQEVLRWPDRETVEQVEWKYSQALDKTGLRLEQIPDNWIGDYPIHRVDLESPPWHEIEIKAILEKYGREKFKGLDLFNY